MAAKTAAAPPSESVALWHTEHEYFQRLLELMRNELDSFHRGERANYELMLDIVGYLTEYSERYHHPREDVAFGRLAMRCPDMKLELARLVQEHRVIARAGEALRQHLESILNGNMVARAEVEIAVATYLVYYGNHIAKEEELVLDRAARVLTAEDWQAVKAAAPAVEDPLFGERPQERFQALRRQVSGQAH